MKAERRMVRGLLALLASGLLLTGALPAAGQKTSAGNVAISSAGRTGERQTRDDITPNVEPMARINNRIQSRVQSRLRTRIDRGYNPDAVFLSPYETAADGARSAGRARRN